MKTCHLLLLHLMFPFSIALAQNSWVEKDSLPSSDRDRAFAVSLNGKGYLGTGFGYSPSGEFQDWWEYDPVTDSWSQEADYPMVNCAMAGFAVNNKIYAGTGEANDIWCEYDPALNVWTVKNDF